MSEVATNEITLMEDAFKKFMSENLTNVPTSIAKSEIMGVISESDKSPENTVLSPWEIFQVEKFKFMSANSDLYLMDKSVFYRIRKLRIISDEEVEKYCAYNSEFIGVPMRIAVKILDWFEGLFIDSFKDHRLVTLGHKTPLQVLGETCGFMKIKRNMWLKLNFDMVTMVWDRAIDAGLVIV